MVVFANDVLFGPKPKELLAITWKKIRTFSIPLVNVLHILVCLSEGNILAGLDLKEDALSLPFAPYVYVIGEFIVFLNYAFVIKSKSISALLPDKIT